MEQILYDYHMADAAYKMPGNGYEPYDMLAFKIAILEKYGYTEAEYDSSMVYYVRHTEYLHQVYEHLADRLSKEALAQGASVSEVNKYATLSETGDTANVWDGAGAMVLNPNEPFNVSSFELKADSTYLPGDKFILEFDTKFHCQDGTRDGMVLMALRFDNDSVATHHQRITSSNHYSLQLSDGKFLGIKELRGFFQILQRLDDEPSKTTLHMLIVENVHLIRMHSKEKPPVVMPTDTLAADSVKSE